MTSAAAKREAIQLRLQELRERGEREQAAFEAVTAAHPELSAQEITALAQQQAAAAASLSLTVDGNEVHVGDRVTVKDDIHLLHRADRGYFGPDVLKQIYLGERGEVTRVMTSFQGKPAVELRFADGASKVFFVECIETDSARATRKAAATIVVSRSSGNRLDLADVPVFVPPANPQAPSPKAEALPGWGQLTMPHRQPTGGHTSDGSVVTGGSLPPPPLTVAALHTSAALPFVVRGKKEASPPPLRLPQDSTDAKLAKAVAENKLAPPARQAVGVSIMKGAPVKVLGTPSSGTRESSPDFAPSPFSFTTAAPIIKRPSAGVSPSSSSSPYTTRHTAAVLPSAASILRGDDVDELDVPSLKMKEGPLWAAGDAARKIGVEEKRELCRTQDLTETAITAKENCAVSAAEERGRDGVNSAADRHFPQTCPATYQAKYALQDDTSRIPRRRSAAATSGTRTCWVCGLTKADAPLTRPVRVALNSQCTAMFSVFAVLTRKLQWDKVQCTASRLFTEKGVEVRAANAVKDGMRLVVTTGCDYQPAVHAEAFSTVPEVRPATSPSASSTLSAEAARRPVAPPSPAAAKKTSAVVQHKASLGGCAAGTSGAVSSFAAAAGVGTGPKHTVQPSAASSASSVSASNKPKHIRVYENGFYEDNIYRTVTVRPAYKTLVALKTTITRELQWRDGKKVDLLFDACGAEIKDLTEIRDGDVVVASAGDRFVIPYPNTPMHMEAMKLSERLNPLRKC